MLRTYKIGEKIFYLHFKNVCQNTSKIRNARQYGTEAKVDLEPFTLHRLEQGPATKATIASEEAIKFYTQMQTIRRLETTASALYRAKKVRGFCHLCSGQEAVAVGIRSAMRPHDSIISSYRIHGIAYVMGISIEGVLCELTGKVTGCMRGKGGSMHMYTKNFYGGNGIVGSQVPLGAGIAFANKYKGNDGVCFTMYGDGAANQGQVYETYNMALLWSLPVIFVCENNKYGMGTSAVRSSANTEFYKRGDQIPGIQVGGMDVLGVREASKFAINHCISGKGPIILEMKTYRYHGHSMSDPGTSYRTREEIQEMRVRSDPINQFKEIILKKSLATNDELSKINKEVNAVVDAALKKANEDPCPPLDELAADIYSKPIQDDIRGTHAWQWYKHKSVGKTINKN